jgi:DNA polymerase II small subunit/DNA polymerase delta subunit B
MVTIKVNDCGLSVSADTTKDLKEITSKENMEKIRELGKTYTNEVVGPHNQREKEMMEASTRMETESKKELEYAKAAAHARKLKYDCIATAAKTGIAVIGCAAVGGVIKLFSMFSDSRDELPVVIDATEKTTKAIESSTDKKSKK